MIQESYCCAVGIGQQAQAEGGGSKYPPVLAKFRRKGRRPLISSYINFSHNFKFDFQEVSCAQCEDWMGRVSALMGTDEFANMVYGDLSGPVFCDDPAFVPAESVAECKGKE